MSSLQMTFYILEWGNAPPELVFDPPLLKHKIWEERVGQMVQIDKNKPPERMFKDICGGVQMLHKVRIKIHPFLDIELFSSRKLDALVKMKFEESHPDRAVLREALHSAHTSEAVKRLIRRSTLMTGYGSVGKRVEQ